MHKKKLMKPNCSRVSGYLEKRGKLEKRLFTEGYQNIYRRVLTQIESLIRNHPVLTQGTIVVPTQSIGTIIIPHEEAVKYIKRQLLVERIHVIGENAEDHTILVTWMTPMQTTESKTINTFSGKTKQTSIELSSSSSSTSSSSASSPILKSSSSTSLAVVARPRGQSMFTATAPPPLKLVNKIPDIISNNSKKHQPPSSSNSAKKATTTTSHTTTSSSKKSHSKLSSKDEAKLARLHTGVLRAATAC